MQLTNFSTLSKLPSREAFLKNLVGEYGVKERVEWASYNGNVHRKSVYVVEIQNIDKDAAHILTEIFNYNMASKSNPIHVVPVAGWNTANSKTKDERIAAYVLEKEYANSYSFQRTVDKDTDVVLRIAKTAMKMKVIHKDNESFLETTPNARIRDADEFLHLSEDGYAFPPNMTTIHVISLGGCATGTFGPSKKLGSMTTNIVAMKVINPLGKPMELSAHQNPELFHVVRDCHLGMCFFVRELTFKIEPQYVMKRTKVLYHNMADYTQAMLNKNVIEKDHFIAMYIPVDIDKENNESYRFQITTYKRTNLVPSGLSQSQKDVADCVQLIKTELGEPLINCITTSKKLHKFFPLIQKQVVNTVYGSLKKSSEVDYSHRIVHPLNTYTDSELRDLCPFIMTESYEDALRIKLEILALTENTLKELAKKGSYPILNAYVRYTRGVPDSSVTGGIAPTAVDKESQGILAFEYLTYANLAETEGYKELEATLLSYLKNCERKFNFHPGKHLPFGMRSLNEILTDEIGQKRQQNFFKAFVECHEGEENIQFSPLATPEKKEFVGYKNTNAIKETIFHREIPPEKQIQALHTIIPIAKQNNDHNLLNKALEHLEKLKK